MIDIDEQIALKHYEEIYESEKCVECNNFVNLYSEGETYDYAEDNEGNTVYLCEDCLNELRSEVATVE